MLFLFRALHLQKIIILGGLRFDDGNVNDNATNQWFD